MEIINDLINELNTIETFGDRGVTRLKLKREAIRKFAEIVFDASRDTYPMDTTPLYKDFNDFLTNQ